MDRLRKVTAFITRGRGPTAELLVFRHGASGVQVPAGTVEPGEDFDVALLRETLEETGLDGPFRVTRLGIRTYDAVSGMAYMREPTTLRTRPAADAPVLPEWPLGYAWPVSILKVVGEFASVAWEVRDLEDESMDAEVFVRIQGWVPLSSLVYGHERTLYHLELQGPAGERWVQQAEGAMLFELYWQALSTPPQLIQGQREWLVEWYDELVRLTHGER